MICMFITPNACIYIQYRRVLLATQLVVFSDIGAELNVSYRLNPHSIDQGEPAVLV